MPQHPELDGGRNRGDCPSTCFYFTTPVIVAVVLAILAFVLAVALL